MESRPEHLLQKLALNALGVCCVPIKPDHLPREQAYVVDHARLDLILALTPRTMPGMYDLRSLKKRH